MNTAPWRYERAAWSAMDPLYDCITLTRIGRIRDLDHIETEIEKIDEILKQIPMVVSDVDVPLVGGQFTCRKWFRSAVRKLIQEGSFVRPIDINRLENALTKLTTAKQYLRNAGLQPRTPAVLNPHCFE